MLTEELITYVAHAATETKKGLAMVTRNPRQAEYQAAGRRRARARPSIYRVAREMGAEVERGEGYAMIAFPDTDRAQDYTQWLRRRGRIGVAYDGGTTVRVWR